jgi:hypothetical protein
MLYWVKANDPPPPGCAERLVSAPEGWLWPTRRACR